MIYTPRALQACGHAAAASRAVGHKCVSSQHLVLGLLEMRTGVAVQILQTLDLPSPT